MGLLIADFSQSVGCNLWLTPDYCLSDEFTALAPVQITTDATALTANMPHTILDGVLTVSLPDPTGLAVANQGDRIFVYNSSLETVSVNYTSAGTTTTVYCIPPGGQVTFRATNTTTTPVWKIE